MIPRLSVAKWGGPSDDSQRWFDGKSIAVEWLGLILELNIGRRTQ
jgi:hypothetical protein